ncbi:MAG: holo-ACP synthase [Gammaproteobacteria bacterium]|nr:holo-ACP synthase [Gammaproteobacteria bacterium]
MIHGIGVDLVDIRRFETSLAKFGKRFSERILTPREQAELSDCSHPARFLAKRFAAKEAAAKAFGTGFQNGLGFRHIGVEHDDLGRPILLYYETAEALKQKFKISGSHLSLSDTDEQAIAFVVLYAAPV